MAHELRQSYANLVDAKLRASLITKSLFSTKYEGVPTAGAVKIPVRDVEVSVGDYSTTNIGSNAVSYGSTTSATGHFHHRLLFAFQIRMAQTHQHYPKYSPERILKSDWLEKEVCIFDATRLSVFLRLI